MSDDERDGVARQRRYARGSAIYHFAIECQRRAIRATRGILARRYAITRALYDDRQHSQEEQYHTPLRATRRRFTRCQRHMLHNASAL